jgi:hypothetical protein
MRSTPSSRLFWVVQPGVFSGLKLWSARPNPPNDLPPMPIGPELLDHRQPGLTEQRLVGGRPLFARLQSRGN